MRLAVACMFLTCACACESPFLTNDGMLVIPQKGARGASVVTANGLEFHDRADVPQRVVVRDPYEPWRAPVGFLVPTNGRFTRTSRPTLVATTGLAVSLRPSDARVPSWGGEMLVRVDVVAPATDGAARWGRDVAVVLDGRGEDTDALCAAALGQLGGRDRILVVDTAGATMVVPPMPASNRSLVAAAVRHRLQFATEVGAVDRAAAVAMAVGALARGAERRVLVLTDGNEAAREGVVRGIGDEFVPLAVVAATASSGTDLGDRVRAVEDFVPPAGERRFGNVVLWFEGSPAPSHVLETSGGDARWELEGGELALGDLRAGEERTEVVRVTVPAWTPGEAFTLHVSARFDDLAHRGERRTMKADLSCAYDDDVERLAESRHGDVIAYASALATLARLDAAFVGAAGARRAADLRALLPIARMHARSLALLARDAGDPAAAAQAALLEALLEATK